MVKIFTYYLKRFQIYDTLNITIRKVHLITKGTQVLNVSNNMIWNLTLYIKSLVLLMSDIRTDRSYIKILGTNKNLSYEKRQHTRNRLVACLINSHLWGILVKSVINVTMIIVSWTATHKGFRVRLSYKPGFR